MKIEKANKLVGAALIAFLVTYVVNILYNWAYYKQYDGPHNSAYHFAKNLELILRYGIGVFMVSLVMMSAIIEIKRRRSSNS